MDAKLTRAERKRLRKLAQSCSNQRTPAERIAGYRRKNPPQPPKNVWWLILVSKPFYDSGVSFGIVRSYQSKRLAAIGRNEERRSFNSEYGWEYAENVYRFMVRKQEPGESGLSFCQRIEMELYGEVRSRRLSRNDLRHKVPNNYSS